MSNQDRYWTYFDEAQLEESDNPFSLVVLVSQERERARQSGSLYDAKRRLIRSMYSKGYSGEEIRALFEFIDWSMEVSSEEDNLIWEEIKEIEEVNNMPYITSVERIGMKKGMEQGIKQGIEHGIKQGIEQGMEQGKREGLYEAISLGLELKFGADGLALMERVLNIKSLEKLEELKEAIKIAKELSDIEKLL